MMMEENKKQEECGRSIELRSEKVRNIVGQIPPVLLRYGIVTIGVTLLFLVVISSFLPYKETIKIDAILYTTPLSKLVKAPAGGMVLFDSLPHSVAANQVVGYVRNGNRLIPIEAPIAGTLVLNVSDGEQIGLGETILAVLPSEIESVYADSEVNREQLSKIRLKNPVVLSTFSGETWRGIVSEIYPIQTEHGMNRIRISFSDTNSCKISGTKVEGTIILSESTILKKILRSIKNQ